MKEKFIKAVKIAILVVLSIVFIFIWPWLGLFIGSLLESNPPKPEITYGEFPFQLVYELDGQQFEVKDTLICKFNGFGVGSNGKYRMWKSYMASGKDRYTLLFADDIEIFYTPCMNRDRAGGVYMGDDERHGGYTMLPFPNAYYVKDFYDEKEHPYIITADDMWEKYKLRLISWKPSPVIKNTFK